MIPTVPRKPKRTISENVPSAGALIDMRDVMQLTAHAQDGETLVDEGDAQPAAQQRSRHPACRKPDT